jgi:hypothetical protein
MSNVKVKLRENVLHQWIIVQVGKEDLACGASRWVPLTGDGLPSSDLKPLSFVTSEGAGSFAKSQGFDCVA